MGREGHGYGFGALLAATLVIAFFNFSGAVDMSRHDTFYMVFAGRGVELLLIYFFELSRPAPQGEAASNRLSRRPQASNCSCVELQFRDDKL